MESEKPSFSSDQDERDLCETVAALIQALEQVEVVGTQLYQRLERLAREGEALRIRIKRQRHIPEPVKQLKNVPYWWDSFAGTVRDYQKWCEGYRIDLEKMQETCDENVAAFKQLREYGDSLPSQ
jgi:hypothetical protein